MNGRTKKSIHPGTEVNIVLKVDQRTGRLTRGIVKDVLTRSAQHPHGIKVRLTGGQVGRVKEILTAKVDGLVKSHISDGFVKSPRSRLAKPEE